MAEFKEVPADAPAAVKALNWVDNRFPLSKLYKEHLSEYYAPKNFNFWYFFGSLDIRYVLFMMDRWGHADRLLKEINAQ
jgi:hypothetical protein